MRYAIIVMMSVLLLAACAPVQTTSVPPQAVGQDNQPSTTTPGSPSTASTVTFNLDSKTFRFYQDGVESPVLTVNRGDTVVINLRVSDMVHDFVIDELPGARTAQGKTGETVSVEFVATTAGSYEYYCSVGQHRERGMKGTLVVQE